VRTRRLAVMALCGVLLLLVSAQAHANGLVYLGLYFLIAGLLVALAKVAIEVTVEAITYRYGLPVPWGRAWLSALVASVPASVAAVAVASTLGSQWVEERWGFLALPLAVGLLAEMGIVWALNSTARGGWRLPTVVLAANVAGWAVFAALAWAAYAATGGLWGAL